MTHLIFDYLKDKEEVLAAEVYNHVAESKNNYTEEEFIRDIYPLLEKGHLEKTLHPKEPGKRKREKEKWDVRRASLILMELRLAEKKPEIQELVQKAESLSEKSEKLL